MCRTQSVWPAMALPNLLLTALMVLNPALAASEELFGLSAPANDSTYISRIDPTNGNIDFRRGFHLSTSTPILSLAFHPPSRHFFAVQGSPTNIPPTRLLEFDIPSGVVVEHLITGLPPGEQFAQGLEYQDSQHRFLVTFAPTGSLNQRGIAETDSTGLVIQLADNLPVTDLDYLVETGDGRLFGFDPNDPPEISQINDVFGSPTITPLGNPPPNANLSDPAFSSANDLFTADVVTGKFYSVGTNSYTELGNVGPGMVGLAFAPPGYTGVADDATLGAGVFFSAIRPNPIAVGAELEFRTTSDGRADLAIFSIDGRKVRTLVRGEWPAGVHQVRWDGRDGRGLRVASGVYLARLSVGASAVSRRITVIR